MASQVNFDKIRNPELRGILRQLFTESNTAAGTPVNAAAAAKALGIATQPTAGDTFTIGSVEYTFIANDAAEQAAGEIKVGENVAGAQANIVAAINGTDGVNTAHTLVTAAAFANDATVVTAKTRGTAGNSIAIASDLTAVADGWAGGAEALSGGVDCTQGLKGEQYVDASYLYIAVADCTSVADQNWRRVSLGSVY